MTMTQATSVDAQSILDQSLQFTQEGCLARLPQAQCDRILESPSPLMAAAQLGIALWVVNSFYDGRGGNEKPVARAVPYDEMLMRQCALYRVMGGNMDQLPAILAGWMQNTAPTPRDGTLGDGPIEIRDGKSYLVQ